MSGLGGGGWIWFLATAICKANSLDMIVQVPPCQVFWGNSFQLSSSYQITSFGAMPIDFTALRHEATPSPPNPCN